MRHTQWEFRVGAAIILPTMAMLVMATLLLGNADTWKTGVSGTFSDGPNWTDATAPGSSDSAGFRVPGTYTVTFTSSPTNQDLFVDQGTITFASSGGTRTYYLTGGGGGQDANITGGTLTLGTGGTPLHLSVGDMLSVQTGGTLQALFNSDVYASWLEIGTSASLSASTMLVDGSGSGLSISSPGNHLLGGSGATGNLTFQNSAGGTIAGTLVLAQGAANNTTGNLTVQSGASLTLNNVIAGAGGAAGQSGTITVTGSGSTVTQNDGASLTLGAAANSIGTLSIANGASYRAGSSSTWPRNTVTVNKTGLIDMSGGTFYAGANITINGGVMQRSATGAFNWELYYDSGWSSRPPTTMSIQSGGRVSFAGDYTIPAPSIVNIAGAGSRMETVGGGSLSTAGYYVGWNYPAAAHLVEINVTNRGVMASDDHLLLASRSALTVDGAGSKAASGMTYVTTWSRDATSGPQPGSIMLAGTSEARVTSGGLLSAGSCLDVDGELEVDGIGSSATAGPDVESYWGYSAPATATFRNGATGSFPGGVRLFMNGSNFRVEGGASVCAGYLFTTKGDATSGPGSATATVTVTGDDSTLTTTGPIGLILGDPTGDGSATMTVADGGTYIGSPTGTTILYPNGLVIIDGGTVSLGFLEGQGGRINLIRGSLGIVGDVAIRSGGPLGENLFLGDDTSLSLTGLLGVDPYARLVLQGGSLTASGLMVDGTFEFRSGTLSFTDSPRIFVGPTGSFETTGPFTNTGRIELLGGGARVAGAGALTNAGLILGGGEIAKPTTNTASGEIRATSGDYLLFSGPNGPNAGRISLLSGTVEFSQGLTNAVSGLITGRGTLIVGGTGLLNQGSMAFSAGITDVFGDVTLTSGAKIITTGAGTTTFWDDVVHNGAEIRTSTGCASVFLGSVSGSGPFTGTGTVYFEGDLSPGSSPAEVSFESDMVLGTAARLLVELGGTTPGTEYDVLDFGGRALLDGTLAIALIEGFVPQAGERFDILNFNPAALAGAFEAVELPTLPNGLVWDRSGLYTEGVIAVVPEPATLALLGLGLAVYLRQKRLR